MIGKEIDENKTKYFVIAIILLIVLGVFLVIHFNNKSLVSGEEEDVITTTTTTTTTKIITTKKLIKKSTKKKLTNIVQEEVKVEETVIEYLSKTTVDIDNKLIYDYKTSNEISNTDVIKSIVLDLTEELITNNIIKLYDISLYDIDFNKKNVNNTNITISIPITRDILGYDDYKIVYIDENNKVTDEEFDSIIENGYIKFTTSHLSKFGIVGIKKEIDLTNVTLDMKINDEIISELKDIFVSTEDKIDIIVNGLEEDYKLYYLLKNDNEIGEYKELNNEFLSSVDTPNKYTLTIKVETINSERIFELGEINIYDIVFNYDKTEEIKEDIIIGEIINEDGSEYDYTDKDKNQDIVIINKEEVLEETEDSKDIENVENEEDKSSDITEETNEDLFESEEITKDTIKEDTLEEDTDENLLDKDSNLEDENIKNNGITKEDSEEVLEDAKEELEEKATIKVNGNIYLVEKTDISNLEMTGHLIIDTNEDITFATYEDKILTSNLYTITIKSKEFSFNGVKYKYEYVADKLVITKVEENKEVENFEELFDGFEINSKEDELVLETYKN